MLISYGTAAPGGPSVTLTSGTPLRLNNAPYAYDEGVQGPGPSAAERLAFLRDHLTDLCDLWAKRPRQFVSLYFRFIERCMVRDSTAIAAKARRLGGLFTPEDFAFSALRPLPRAHLHGTRADFAFWTGTALIALDIVGDDARGAALNVAGVRTIEIPASAIARDDPGLLEQALPPDFQDFWRDEALPSSPFKATGLGDVAATPDF